MTGFIFYYTIQQIGEVSELADEHGLGPCALGRGGSNPPFPSLLFLALAVGFNIPPGVPITPQYKVGGQDH